MVFCIGGSALAADRPNVLFISIDDMRTELGCYGVGSIHTPNIDRLAGQGVQFNHAHVQQSICMASRASMMSGFRPENHRIYTTEPMHQLLPDALTMNRHFANNGYQIAAYGKIYHYGSDHVAQFGDNWFDDTDKWAGRGYATKAGIEIMELNQKVESRKGKRKDRGPAWEAADVDDNGYIDGYNTELTVEKLKELSANDAPFFLAIGLHKPHLPFCAPKKYWDLYPEDQIAPAPVTEPPLNSSRYTLRDPGELRNYFGMPAEKGSRCDEVTTRNLRRGYFACVSYIDALVGQLMSALDAQGLAENTVVILWGDHGYKLGDYGTWNKWSNMTLDTRVPLIVRGPGVSVGHKSEALVELIDIYPTLAQLCGLPLPKHLEGTSFVPVLEQPGRPWKKAVFTMWPHDRTEDEKNITGYSVKTRDFNYVEWTRLKTGEVLERELYDQNKDPLEMVNCIDDKAYEGVVTEMQSMLRSGWKDALPPGI
jgi:iduronate 2-sulfatase